MLGWLADKLILQPTTHTIPTEGKQRRVVRVDGGSAEIWSQRTSVGRVGGGERPAIFILKFVGTAGRAERATEHPAECWDDTQSEVWSVNPPGYGGGDGRARLSGLARAARAAYGEIVRAAQGCPILVTGNSLGGLAALHVAARFDVDGLVLRNPPPLRQLIVGRHAWWNLGLGAWLIARQVPDELCAIQNAAASRAPALFVMSEKDRMVPPRYQRQIIAAYGGEHRVFVIPDADHASKIEEAQRPPYRDLLVWLRETACQRHAARAGNGADR